VQAIDRATRRVPARQTRRNPAVCPGTPARRFHPASVQAARNRGATAGYGSEEKESDFDGAQVFNAVSSISPEIVGNITDSLHHGQSCIRHDWME